MGDQQQGRENPLDRYRRKASFSVPEMRNYLIGEELVKYSYQVGTIGVYESSYQSHLPLGSQVWDTLERDPLFAHQDVDLTLDQKRELTFKRVKRLFEYDFLPTSEALQNPAKMRALNAAGQMYDISLFASFNLSRIVSDHERLY